MQKELTLKRKAPGDAQKGAPAGKKPFTPKPGFQRGNSYGQRGGFQKGAKTFNRNGPGGYGGRQFNNNKPAEKQDWNKMKQDKKELKVKRKERRVKDKDIYELTSQAKKIYEKLKW